jgi:hypothetical protein
MQVVATTSHESCQEDLCGDVLAHVGPEPPLAEDADRLVVAFEEEAEVGTFLPGTLDELGVRRGSVSVSRWSFHFSEETSLRRTPYVEQFGVQVRTAPP